MLRSRTGAERRRTAQGPPGGPCVAFAFPFLVGSATVTPAGEPTQERCFTDDLRPRDAALTEPDQRQRMKARLLLAAPLLAAAALALAPTAPAGPGLLVGVDDDSLEWYTQTHALISVYRDLGVGAVRVTLSWQPGEWSPSRTDRQALNRV